MNQPFSSSGSVQLPSSTTTQAFVHPKLTHNLCLNLQKKRPMFCIIRCVSTRPGRNWVPMTRTGSSSEAQELNLARRIIGFNALRFDPFISPKIFAYPFSRGSLDVSIGISIMGFIQIDIGDGEERADQNGNVAVLRDATVGAVQILQCTMQSFRPISTLETNPRP
ncbi:hypothetical protein HAX54_048829 [Datura stramonium]|uniref:Uncharacterized protein n=1 Tax=Datura stramonium TaxID=4076 RepID=A0ABS8SUJ7_DATST|nr:hypothetical protein [Datura stramonium]